MFDGTDLFTPNKYKIFVILFVCLAGGELGFQSTRAK